MSRKRTAAQAQQPGPVVRTRVVPDEPATSDLFGGHDLVAEGIVDLLLSEEKGGRTVGLEGEWGSGKSTVVELVKRKLGERAKGWRVFIYDTWAHEGDPLRRSFLEALGNSLTDEELNGGAWIDPIVWKETKERLAKRHRHATVRTKPRFTRKGRWLTGSLFLAPIGAAFLGWALDQEDWLVLVLSIPLMLAPVLLGVWFLFAQRNDDPTSDDYEDPWAIFSKAGVTDQTTDTFETPDPTSIEFAEKFDELMAGALDEVHPDRRMVIVLDNLDRVDPEVGLRTLASLQAFFGFASIARGKQWRNRLWVILPYDRAGLRALWKDEEVLVESFLSKIRNLRFEVPPPILSDWQNYLNQLMEEAFPLESDDERSVAASVVVATRLDLRVLEVDDTDAAELTELAHRPRGPQGVGHRNPPTPRDLIRLVNLIGSFHRQREDIPLNHLAYYASLRDLRQRPGAAEDLLDGVIPGKTPRAAALLSGTEEDLVSSLAALHFNTSLERGTQLLLGEPLTLALQTGDAETTGNLFARYGETLWVVLAVELDGGWASGGGSGIAKVGRALMDSGVVGSMPANLKSRFRRLLTGVDEWAINGHEDGADLARFAVEVGVAVADAEKLVCHLAHQSEAELEQPALKGRVEGAVGLALGLKEAGLWDPVASSVELVLPGSNDQIFVACGVLADAPGSRPLWPLVRSRQPAEEVVADVAKWPSTGPADGKSISALSVLSENQRFDLRPAVEAAAGFLGSSGADAGQVAFTVQMLEVMPDGPDTLKTLASDGWLLDHLQQASGSGFEEFAGLLAFHHLDVTRSRSMPQPSSPPPQSAQGAQRLQELVDNPAAQSALQQALIDEIVARDSDLPFAFELSEQRPYPWAKAFISEHAEMINARRLVDYWDAIWPSLGRAGWESEVRRLVDDGSLLPEMLTHLEHGDVGDHLGLIWRIIQAGPARPEDTDDGDWTKLYEATASWLRGLSKDDWLETLDQHRPPPWVGLALESRQHAPRLASPFEEALLEFGQKAMTGEASPPPQDRMGHDGDWAGLPLLIESGGNDLALQLRMRLARHLAAEKAVESVFWEMFGPFLAQNSGFINHELLLPEVVSNAVRFDDKATLGWFAELFEARPDVIKAHSRNKVVKLKDLIAEKVSEGSGDELEALAASLGITLDDESASDT